MANGIRTDDIHRFNKGRSSKFRVGSQVRQTPEEGWRTYRPKRCGNNNKDEDNSPKTLNDKKHQVLSQKFTQLLAAGPQVPHMIFKNLTNWQIRGSLTGPIDCTLGVSLYWW